MPPKILFVVFLRIGHIFCAFVKSKTHSSDTIMQNSYTMRRNVALSWAVIEVDYMQRKKNGKEMKSFAQVLLLLTMITISALLCSWAIINHFISEKTHGIQDVLIFVCTGVIIVSLIIIMYNLSNKDMLTKALNKDAVTLHLVMLFITKKLDKYTTFYVNIRGFKYINRMYSAKQGDVVLIKYASAIKKFVSSNGFVGRLGGDNFIIVIKDEYATELLRFLERIDIVLTIGDNFVNVPVYSRCGIHNLSENDGVSEAFNYSSIAFNYAKSLRSGYYLYYKKEFEDSLFEEQKISANYRDAIKNNEFVVYYQPKVNINSNCLCGAEALIRWSVNGEIKSPYTFVPALERLGLIPELDFWVFEQVLKRIKKWEQDGLTPITVSSNFSKQNLKDENFINKLVKLIDEYKVDKKYVRIEFTESSDIEDHALFLSVIDEMKELGIQVAIDDFGTGYSSLELILNDSVNYFKLDKSFIDNITVDKSSAFLVSQLIETALAMDKSIICEGVETSEQLELLKTYKCSYVQGYLYDKPLPEEDFVKRLQSPIYRLD